MERLQEKIKSKWNPKFNENKKVTVFFQISKKGELIGAVRVTNSSGSREADDLAIKAVEASAPFERLPNKYKEDKVDISFEFSYKRK